MTEIQALALALVKKRRRIWPMVVREEIGSGMHPLLGNFNPNREFDKLEKKGFLTSTQESDEFRYTRRVYRITASGISAIKKYQKHMQQVEAALSNRGR